MPPAAELRTPSPRKLVGGKQREYFTHLHSDREWWDIDSFTTSSDCSTQFTENILLGDRPSWKDSMRRLHWCCLPFVSRRQIREDFLSQVAEPTNEMACREEKLQLRSSAAALPPPPPPPPPIDTIFIEQDEQHQVAAPEETRELASAQPLQRAVSQTGRPPRAGAPTKPMTVERVSSAPSPTIVPKSTTTTNTGIAARSRPTLPPRAPSALAAARQVSAASSCNNNPRRRANTLASRDVSTASTHRRQVYESFQFSVDTLQAIYNPKEEPTTKMAMTTPPQMINITPIGSSEFSMDNWVGNDDDDALSMDSLRLSSDEEDENNGQETNDDTDSDVCHKSQEKDRRSPDSVVEDKNNLIAPWMMAWMKGTTTSSIATSTEDSQKAEAEPLAEVCGTAYFAHSIQDLVETQELVHYSVVRTQNALKVIAKMPKTTKSLYLKKSRQDACSISTQYVSEIRDCDCGGICVQIQGHDSQGRPETWYLLPHKNDCSEKDDESVVVVDNEKEQCVSSMHLRFALDAAYMALVKGTALSC